MQSLDLEVLTQLKHWLSDGQQPWLCTIVTTVGSSPRPVGSMLALSGGDVVGTLSGGCVEEHLLDEIAQRKIASDSPQRLHYGVSAEQNERLGLPCGGQLEIIVQQLSADDDLWITRVIEAINQRQLITRTVDLASGHTQLQPVNEFKPLQINAVTMEQSFGPKMRMLLVGAGQLGQLLADLAIAMDFEVLVIDPRESTLAQWRGPDVPLLHGLPDDMIASQAVDRHSVIITLTHDPRIDDMALLEALETDAWYVGALGSVRTTRSRLERLATLGLSAAQLARLHAPVGLPIGSKTPWEIAIAIMAEITQLRRLG